MAITRLTFGLIVSAFVFTQANAATSVGNFQVQINIQATCIFVAASDLNFGNAGVLSASVDSTSTISVQCTTTTPYTIGLNQGVNGSSVTTRQMAGAGGLINYSIFRDAGRTQNWGTTAGSDTVAGVGNGAAQNYTVYGRVPAQTTPAPALYTDTITVTVTY
ncbi:spore coat U domain-containing protein [Bosea sp. ASV33]|uniref:Csu type fimbrial protein n=1 Tax=Bosea sp. ASV33 TaxID=2795106 RepID=UPI0018EA7933|nr:spore coat U domain-containing protein [Bosea sp. ASV33]